MAAKGKKLIFKQLGGEQSIPPKFIAAMGRGEEVQALGENVTNPETLATTIVESKVETNRTNERVRRTIKKTSGTITLAEKVRTEHGIANRTETMQMAGTYTPGTSALTLKEESENLGNGQEVTDKLTVSEFPLLVGQAYDRTLNTTFKFTEQRQAIATAASSLGTAGVDITPEDFSRSVVRTYDITAAQTVLDAIVESNPTLVNLPNWRTLTGFTARFSKQKADGLATKTAVSASAGADEFSLSISAEASAQGSAAIVADIVPDITPFDGDNRNAIEYFFFMSTVYTRAALLTRLTTLAGAAVAAWPSFNTKPLTLVAYGERRTEAHNGEFSESVKVTPTPTTYASRATGMGVSGDVSMNTKLIQIPETLHAALTLPGTDTQDFSVAATAIGGGSSYSPSALNNVATGGFSSSTANLSATSPAAVPSSGKYLFKIDTQSYGFGRKLIRAIVVDFADL